MYGAQYGNYGGNYPPSNGYGYPSNSGPPMPGLGTGAGYGLDYGGGYNQGYGGGFNQQWQGQPYGGGYDVGFGGGYQQDSFGAGMAFGMGGGYGMLLAAEMQQQSYGAQTMHPPPGQQGYAQSYTTGTDYTRPPQQQQQVLQNVHQQFSQYQQQPPQQQHQQQHAAPQQQAEFTPPAPPPQSILYQQASAGMQAANMREMQYEMLQELGVISDDSEDEETRQLTKKERQRARRQAKRKSMQQMMSNQEQEEPVDKEAIRKEIAAEMKEEAEKAKAAAEKLSQDADLKSKMKELFVNELMRRQEVSGTFEITEGTVTRMNKYPAEDPVAAFYSTEKSQNLAGENWSCEADCEYLRKAMKGLGTDEDAIIHVVTTRCNAQRQEMKELFKTMYGRDLIDDLRDELSGDFRESVMACFVKPAIFDAWSVKEAIYGLGTDEQTLIEIFMTRTNEQLKALKEVYAKVVSPNRTDSATLLDNDIIDDTSGDFKQLMRSAAMGGRVMISREQLENGVQESVINGTPTGMFVINFEKLVDIEKCKREAKELFAAGEEKWGTDEETFIRIFAMRNYYELRMIWNQYVKISQRDILNSIDRETSGNFKKGLAGIVRNIRCRPMYFAERLKAAMKGLGTADKDLIRIIVSRSEIDMVQIKQCFLELTKQTLWRWLKDDCSGDYRKLLQGLVGKD